LFVGNDSVWNGYLYEITLPIIHSKCKLFTDKMLSTVPNKKLSRRRLKKKIYRLRALKKRLDNVSACVLRHARIYNSFPVDKSKYFNRGYAKLAEMDEHFGLTCNISTFADLCGGPGGFALYILDHTKSTVVGYGMTLKCINDYSIRHCSRFHKLYGKNCDGDIMNPENIQNFPLNLDLVVADGAFDTSGRESDQELLHHQLFLAEAVCGLRILRVGGSMVIKVFDCFDKHTILLLYHLQMCFESMTSCKPIHSRVANSEKYYVFKSRKTNLISQGFLTNWYERGEVPPAHVGDSFFEYMLKENTKYVDNQLRGLRGLLHYTDG